MTGSPPIVHLTAGEGLSSVFLSQVARPMSQVRERGYDATLAVISPLGEFVRPQLRERWRARRQEIAREFGLEVRHFPSAPSRMSKGWDDSLMLRAWLRLRFPPGRRVILHCRGTEATQTALRARAHDGRLSVVSDCRGLDAPEYLLHQGFDGPEGAPQALQRGFRERTEAQRTALLGGDAIICVSDAMRREIVETWDVPDARISVVPCCADVAAGARAAAKRTLTRASLELEGRFVVGYCGSTAPWQVVPQVFAAFREIAAFRDDAHLLAITTDLAGLTEAADDCGIDPGRRTIISVPHADVARYLAAADLGLLLRDKSIVNRVAAPVKFAEYLSCGVPVVLTEGIGDYSSLVRKLALGCVLSGLAAGDDAREAIGGFLASYERESGQIRLRCLSAAKENLSWDGSIDALCATYDAVSNFNARGPRDALVA
jgi:glycosyltransferase involved in cell wall biosynthesis